MEYSELTITITNKLSKKEKKDHGIFITPRTIIERLFASLPPINPSRILEPSAGTCEIANYALFQFPHAHIDAVEFNDTIYAATSSVVPPTINYIHADYTRWSASKPYDLIVGNPPYVVCAKEDVPVQYHDYVVGRPNLFCTFMLHSISMLAEGGILAFVIPTSFLNAAYYARLRNYMKTTGTILNIVNFADNNKFIETQQATIGIIFRKEAQAIVASCPFSVKFGANYVFTENAANIHAILAGSTTLAQMGIRVKTGTIVWNEHKAVITDDASKTLLIYNTNVAKTNQVVVQTFANEEKKQYIDLPGLTEPIIVVNRGNGNSAYKLSYAFVDGSRPYLVENHLNMILCGNAENARRILASFANKKTGDFVSTFLGNNGLSKTELETIFPIYM